MANIQPRYDKNGKLISFSIRVFRGRGADGKQLKPWTATFEVTKNQKEDAARKKAEAFAATFEEKCKSGLTSDNRQKFADYAEYVIKMKEHNGIKHSTIVWYREQAERVNPEIGHIKLKDLRADNLNSLYLKLSETKIKPTKAKAMIDLAAVLKEKKITRTEIAEKTGLSENTVRICIQGKNCSVETARKIAELLNLKFEKTFLVLNENKQLSSRTVSGYHRFISSVLSQAVKEGLIPFNVAERAEIPKIKKKKIGSFQTSELISILNALEKEPLKWRVVVHLLMITGARRGEVLGIRWSDIDEKSNSIHICNNVLYTPDRGTYQDSVKTEESDRWIAIPAETMKLLKEWKDHQEEETEEKGNFFKNPDQLLFTQENGSPMCPDSVTTYLRRFSKKYNLPHIHPHKFRHTMASMLIFERVDPVSVSHRLGHSQVSTTTDIYADAFKEAEEKNADILAGIFLKKA